MKGDVKKLLCSACYPADDAENSLLNETSSSVLKNAPRKSNIIAGHDINTNIGTRMQSLHRGILELFEFSNRDVK